MIKATKTVAFSGHRSEKLPKESGAIRALKLRTYAAIDQAIQEGYDTFITGACYGFDLLAAEQVLLRKQVADHIGHPKIRLIAAVPHEHQAIHWKTADREQYYDTLAQCDEVVTLNTHYRQGCFHERNRWMIDRASRLICCYDGSGGGTGYTVDYARKSGLTIINLCETEESEKKRE